MKTLILNGSTRKNGDTSALIAAFTAELTGDIRIVNAQADSISPCLDCRHCWTHSGCCIQDKMQEIYPYFEECDNLVIASPVWFGELSGPLLSLLSRMQHYFAARIFRHETPPILPKRGILLLAGAQPGTEEKAISTAQSVFKYLNTDCTAIIRSTNTDRLPAGEDSAALALARRAANEICSRR